MTPDPRELLKELIEEGSDAFRGWRNCSTPPCRWNEKSFFDAGSGASSVETTPTGTRPRRCQLEWDSFKSGFHKYVTWSPIPGARVPLGESPEDGHRRDVRDGVSTARSLRLPSSCAAPRSPPARSQESPSCWTTNSSSFATALWAAIITWMPTTRRFARAAFDSLESDRSQLLGQAGIAAAEAEVARGKLQKRGCAADCQRPLRTRSCLSFSALARMLSKDPTNCHRLTFEHLQCPVGGEAEAMLRARVEQYSELADWMEPICRKALRSFVLQFYLAAHSHQQRAGEPKPSDSPAYPGRRYLSKHRVGEDWLIGKQYLSLVDFKPQENPISDHSQSNYRKTVA